MSTKQRIALVAPILLIFSMLLIYRQLSLMYQSRVAWYIGFWIYWFLWCGAFSFLMVGKVNMLRLIRPRKPRPKAILFVLFPVIMAAGFKFMTGTAYSKPSIVWLILLISSAFGNGFFEEVLWRGVYMILFPESILYRIIWPTIWFALWHYAPGSLSPNSNIMGLIIGSGLFGFYLAFLAKKTNTLWWGILAHTLGGIVMVI